MTKSEQIIDIFSSFNIEITAEQGELFSNLTDFMLEYNKKHNLTRITEFSEIVIKHYIDSILPLTLVEISHNSTIIDVGTGAGFPSIPMMIFRSDLNFTLIDSLNKRVVYLQQACSLLGLECEIVHNRGELFSKTKREYYDFSIARAVAPLPILNEYCLPFVKVGGKFLAMKGPQESTECKSIGLLGGELSETLDYSLPNGDKRTLVIIDKISPTPTKYPRASGIITKKPLS